MNLSCQTLEKTLAASFYLPNLWQVLICKSINEKKLIYTNRNNDCNHRFFFAYGGDIWYLPEIYYDQIQFTGQMKSDRKILFRSGKNKSIAQRLYHRL